LSGSSAGLRETIDKVFFFNSIEPHLGHLRWPLLVLGGININAAPCSGNVSWCRKRRHDLLWRALLWSLDAYHRSTILTSTGHVPKVHQHLEKLLLLS
jgi:hypothetical protein